MYIVNAPGAVLLLTCCGMSYRCLSILNSNSPPPLPPPPCLHTPPPLLAAELCSAHNSVQICLEAASRFATQPLKQAFLCHLQQKAVTTLSTLAAPPLPPHPDKQHTLLLHHNAGCSLRHISHDSPPVAHPIAPLAADPMCTPLIACPRPPPPFSPDPCPPFCPSKSCSQTPAAAHTSIHQIRRAAAIACRALPGCS